MGIEIEREMRNEKDRWAQRQREKECKKKMNGHRNKERKIKEKDRWTQRQREKNERERAMDKRQREKIKEKK